MKEQLELLEWIIRLTYSGMPLPQFRYWIIKKHEELERELKNSQAQPSEGEEWRGERP